MFSYLYSKINYWSINNTSENPIITKEDWTVIEVETNIECSFNEKDFDTLCKKYGTTKNIKQLHKFLRKSYVNINDTLEETNIEPEIRTYMENEFGIAKDVLIFEQKKRNEQIAEIILFICEQTLDSTNIDPELDYPITKSQCFNSAIYKKMIMEFVNKHNIKNKLF